MGVTRTMQRPLRAKRRSYSFGLYTYLTFLAVLFAGLASLAREAMQPLVLKNPGISAYKPPPAVALYPVPRTYLSPAEPVELAVSEPPKEAAPAKPAGKVAANKADA